MDNIREFQRKLLTDASARAEFAANPEEYLKKNGISLPPGTKVPSSIPVIDLEQSVSHVQQTLEEKGITLEKLGQSDPTAVTKYVHDAIGTKMAPQELAMVHGGKTGTVSPDAKTAVVIGAVVVAVVAVPVAVFGASDQ
jgi:hypothetical protein